jgi:imidazolonepropionase
MHNEVVKLAIQADILITNAKIATVAGGKGPKCGAEMKDIGYIENGSIAISADRIVYVGSTASTLASNPTAGSADMVTVNVSAHILKSAYTAESAAESIEAKEVIDAGGRLVTPGLVDPHTHLVHAGSRQNELRLKLEGKGYLEILAAGGGIHSTVKSTRAAAEEELTAQAHKSLVRMLEHGTTTVEAKSGYGLDAKTELKQLRVAKALSTLQPVEIVPTFLGPHALPQQFKGYEEAFLQSMIDLLNTIREEGLAEFCDIFCEDGVFSVDQSRKFLSACQNKGFGVKIHADEIEPMGGTELAAELHAISADHLLAASHAGLDAIAKSGTIAVLLPGTSWNLRARSHANARYIIDEAGGAVALATDYNPGSCPTESLQLVQAFAANLLQMTPEEILTATTRNAAYAIGRGDKVGTIEVGKQADLCMFDTDDFAYIPYHFGVNHIYSVFKQGKKVVQNGHLLAN